MAHLGQWTIKAKDEYQKVSDITGITFEDNKTYLFQVQNSAIVISSATVPEKGAGGFYINKPDLNTYTKQAGADLYIKTTYQDVVLNISE